jgi:DNA repair protein RAD50
MSPQAERDKAEGLQQENAMISRKAEASKAVSDLEQQLAEKRRWEASRDEATRTKRDCEKREKDVKADAPARKAALDKARRDQEEATSQWTARKKKARAKTNGAKAAAYAVTQAVAQAARGDKRIQDAETTLAELQETKAQYEKDVAEAEDAASDVHARIQDASKSEDTRMLEKKEVEGVLEYRAQRKKKEACEEKLQRAKDQEPDQDDEFAGKSQQDLSRRLSRITQELERVAAEKGEHEGQRKQAREVAREHANDLATARYKGVEERHRRAMIDKETTEMACKDVEHYWTALDKALGSFHRLKIEEINRIIKELWSVTYCVEINQ